MAYANGQIPLSALQALSTGGHLLAPTAAAFETWRQQAAAAGYDMRPTTVGDAYRTLERQISVFRDRYEMRPYPYVGPYNDVRYWNGARYVRMRGAAAAVPGTSNHGKGLAIDIKNAGGFGGAYHNWMSRTGPALGFTNVEGRRVNEPWHWVHNGVWTVNNPITGGGSGSLPNPGIPNLPDPLEDGMTQADVARLENKIDQLLGGVGAIGAINTPANNTVLGIVRGLRDTAIPGIPNKVWSTTVDRGSVKVGALQELADTKTLALQMKAQIDTLTKTVETLANAQGLSSEQVLAAVREGAYEGAVKAVKDGIIVDVNVSGGKE